MANIPDTIATKPAAKLTNGWIELIVKAAPEMLISVAMSAW
jgi:hypothetical protein